MNDKAEPQNNKIKREMPTYTAEENGLDQDRDTRSPRTLERNARRAADGRHALIAQLNDGRGSVADLVSKLRHPLGLGEGAPERIVRIAIYLRVSTEEQAKKGGEAEGYSIPYQRDACLGKVRQLGGILVCEYVDAGESAKSADRPQLQKMLRELKTKHIDFVIVHKIDRLARNRSDDVEINTAIARAGAKLISVAEPVDETPAGKLLYNMMADVAQYHSDNLAVEVLKGMDTKAKRGGTPYRAPLGYLNWQEVVSGVVVRTIRVDDDRAPLITWAFEEYATGLWSIRELVDALNAQGLRSRATPKRPAKPLTVNGLHYLLRNPYYMGVVPYRGVFHEGAHEPLVDSQLWLRVQETLHAHHLAGDKSRVHNHYLKGSVFCGECGSRLVFTRNKGRGGTYDYYDCLSKKTKRKPCTRKAIRLEKLEDGIARFYATFQLREGHVTLIRRAVLAELATNREEAAKSVARAEKRLVQLQDERAKLLPAHYAGAVPLDLLKSEMLRLTSETADAERIIADAKAAVSDLETVLNQALLIASSCAVAYLSTDTTSGIRRQFNQGLFKALYVNTDGDVERYELTEPFGMLLDPDGVKQQHPGTDVTESAGLLLSPVETEMQDEDRLRSSWVISSDDQQETHPDDGIGRVGSNNGYLVPPAGLHADRSMSHRPLTCDLS